ncbi:hypothetical protein BDZ89DRAFT_1108995 [Hymenopellis radicata]|nr:hypothetical protein BDZ89DRAFT_1108995 [Hymenopellis radicata]
MPPSAESPYLGAAATGAARASLQRALDHYKTGHINLPPQLAGSELNRSDTRSFGESHASELSSMSSDGSDITRAAQPGIPMTPPGQSKGPDTVPEKTFPAPSSPPPATAPLSSSPPAKNIWSAKAWAETSNGVYTVGFDDKGNSQSSACMEIDHRTSELLLPPAWVKNVTNCHSMHRKVSAPRRYDEPEGRDIPNVARVWPELVMGRNRGRGDVGE